MKICNNSTEKSSRAINMKKTPYRVVVITFRSCQEIFQSTTQIFLKDISCFELRVTYCTVNSWTTQVS